MMDAEWNIGLDFFVRILVFVQIFVVEENTIWKVFIVHNMMNIFV